MLRDTAIDVLADGGAHALTHRAVDRAAAQPLGTTKNYFATRDALLLATTERVYERYLYDQEQLAALGAPSDRDGLVAVLAELIRRGTSTDRPRLMALLELHAEAQRRPSLGRLLAKQTEIDYRMYDRLQRAAGLPGSAARSRVLARTMQSTLLSLLTHPDDALAAQGLDDIDAFVRGVVDAVYPA
ncbi:MAG: TetR/AcrR family transcriptional regulator [Actinophytocola sp.]|nr:TetR/AcrR family transcriptional regulator [Actinophytocola sp.]